MIKISPPWARTLASLSVNISATWLILAFVTPNFSNIKSLEAILVLTLDIALGIIFLYIAARLEKLAEKS